MSRRKQTNPRAIKRDVSQDEEDETSTPIIKKLVTESIRSDSTDSPVTIENDNEQKNSSIKCDSCQELFLTSEQFNQHRLYQCSFFQEETNSDESGTSSYDDYANQIDTISFGTSQNEEYPHQCSYCNKSFSNMALLLKHEQIHVDLMPFRCSFCGKGFKHRRSLNRHSKLHTGERKFKCTLCESTFARSDHLKAHIRTHNNSNGASIDKTPNFDFQLKVPVYPKSSLDEHHHTSDIKTSKDENKAEHCPYCPRICLGEDSLRLHIQNEHCDEESKSERISPFLSDTHCHLCNAKFNTRENYYAHIRCTHPLLEKQFLHSNLSTKKPVEITDDSLLNEYAFIEKIIWCEKCKRSFDSMTHYLQHYSIQHCLQIIKCLQCDDIFETSELFFNHIERKHPSKTVETFKCKLCNAAYKHRIDFLHHVQTIHKLNTYSCSLCSSQLNSLNDLVDHFKLIHKINNNNIDIHLNNYHRRPSFNTLFPCQYCSKKFYSRFEFNQHIAHEHQEKIADWHENEKQLLIPASADIVCSLCDLTFPSEFLLSEHNKHTHRSIQQSPSFKCTYCYALFTSRTQLDRHSRIHIASSGNNLKCNICDRIFSTIDILSEHKLSHCKATTSNICSYCHKILNNENDYTNHLYEHNNLNYSKNKIKLFSNTTEQNPVAIACIVCKQSLINEHEVDLHMKFHLTNLFNKKPPIKDTSLIMMTITCNQCQKSTNINREFLLELPSFTINCFNCIEKDLKATDSCSLSEIDSTSTSLSCPKCQSDIEFDSIKTYQQHFTSVHLSKHSVEEYQCLKCNKIVPSRDHILQHQQKTSLSSSSSSSFLIDTIDSSNSSSSHVNYCYLCRTNFDSTIKLHIHLIEHQYPNHDYQCTFCNQTSFDDSTQLYNHMIKHGSKARLYPCRECDIYFMFSMHLINHQYSHNEEILLSKSNGNSKQLKDDDENSCKSIVTRSSSTKGTCRSVIVS